MKKTVYLIAFYLRLLAIDTHAQDHKITIQKNGDIFIEFLAPGATALLDENNLTMEMNSPDLKHSLVLNLFPFGQEAYPLNGESEKGMAVLMLLSDELTTPLTFESGVLKLIQIDSDKISCSIIGKKNLSIGDTYSLEISLKDIPLRKL